MDVMLDAPERNGRVLPDPLIEAFQEGLRQRLAERDRELQRLQAERRRLDAAIVDVQQHLDALRVLARQEGLALSEIGPSRVSAPAGPGTQRRGSRVPARQPEYASSTLLEAAAALLGNGDPWHVDDLIDRIFVVGNREQHRAARASLASALGQGVLQGRWGRVRPGVYQIDPIQTGAAAESAEQNDVERED